MGRMIDEDDVIAEIEHHKQFIMETQKQKYGNTDEIADLYFLAHDHIKEAIKAKVPSAQPEPRWIPCSECMYWRDERVLMNNGKARQYNGDEPDELGIKHSVSVEVGINQGAMCLYEEDRGWSTDHTTFRNADDFCSRAKKRPCSYEEWYGIVDGVYAEPWRGEEHETD